MSRDQSPLLPSTFAVAYRVRRCAGGVADAYPPFYVSEVLLSDLTPTDGAVVADLVGTVGSRRTVRDCAVALYSTPAGPPTNKAALDTLARRHAQDSLDWATAATPGDVSYAGIAAPAPSALVDRVEWDYTPGRVATRLVAPPYRGHEPEEYQHWDGAAAHCTDAHNGGTPVQHTPGIEVYGPPEGCTGGGGKVHASSFSSSGGITAVAVDAPGSYTSAPAVQVDRDNAGTGFAAHAVLTGSALTSVVVDTPGSGYPPDVILSLSGGGAQLQRTRYRLYLEDGRLATRFVSTDTIG